MDTARPLRDLFAELNQDHGQAQTDGQARDRVEAQDDVPAQDDGPAQDVLRANGHADLPDGLVAEAVGTYADTAPIEVAEHLAPYVMAHSPVPLPDAPDIDPSAWFEAVATAPAGPFVDGPDLDSAGLDPVTLDPTVREAADLDAEHLGGFDDTLDPADLDASTDVGEAAAGLAFGRGDSGGPTPGQAGDVTMDLDEAYHAGHPGEPDVDAGAQAPMTDENDPSVTAEGGTGVGSTGEGGTGEGGDE